MIQSGQNTASPRSYFHHNKNNHRNNHTDTFMNTNHLSLRPKRRMSLNNIALLIVLGASSAFANLVEDGSFEDTPAGYYDNSGPMGPWTVQILGSAVGIYESSRFGGANVTDGNQAFDLGMGGYASGNSLSQVLPTVAGQTYRLSFDWGSEYGRGTSAFVSVGNLNENLIEPAAGGPYDVTSWIINSSSFLFIASGNDTLTFSEPAEPLDYWGLALDNVSVVLVSLPQLTLVPSGPNLILTWPIDATGLLLQSATMLANGGDWQDFPTAPTEIDGQNVVTITPTGPCGFFRLYKP